MKKLAPIEKKDTRIFKKQSNAARNRAIKNGIKSLIHGRIRIFRLCFKNAKSLGRNKNRNDYPKSLIESIKRIVVYTVLYGNYDDIKPIKVKNPLCDYFILTDQVIPGDSGWVPKEFVFPKEIGNDPILKNRYLKMHPHLLFPEYDYSIYLDAVFTIELDIFRLMARMGEHIFGLFDHHRGTDCLYEEAKILKRINKVPATDIDKQMSRYEKEGFPHHFGFVECGVIIRKHNSKKCIDIMDMWWNEFINGAKRDQLSFMYSIWKNNLTKKDIAYLGATFWDDPIIPSIGHKQ